MSSASWHARVECGRDTGAGFLVSDRHVLTCAHVVRDRAASAVAVSFPHRKDLGTVAAAVGAHGGWGGRGDDPGDLAVLELDHPVPIAPAGFAPPDHAYTEPRPRLVAYGFPRGYEEGTIAEYRATAAQLIADEWIQLEAWNAHGQPLAPGFSGAAVALADSGLVVGMVSAVAGTAGVRNGRMLPAPVMARYWPRLAELIPAPGPERPARQRLRDLVERAENELEKEAGAALAGAPERLYLDAVGPLGPPVPPGGFASLWSAAWYVLWEVDVPGAVERFADRLAALVDVPPAPRTPHEAPPASPGGAPSWSPILVELARSGAGGDQVLVEVSASREGRRHPVGSRTLARGQVRPYVQERIEEAFGQLSSDAEELIAFVLPREWLNEPVAHWERSADDPTPLGCSYPLVVTDRARRAGGLRHQLARKWERLDGKATTAVHRVECDADERPNKLRFRLRRDEADLAGFPAPPKSARLKPHFDVSLNAPAPVLLWPRVGCEHGQGGERGAEGVRTPGAESVHTPGAAGGPCGGPRPGAAPCYGSVFLDALAAHLSRLPPAELPRHVLALRESADAADEPERHWARDIQLLWDDPRCFPDAAAAPSRSPVA
ncbi:trypsin-like peptidase domain-containing protein [Streptomyces sp. NPDC059063]|uniref:VMAP-C domain-containing protein n=1 Tax=unclassified Streptomyces TaxID=2593676 RepID=UPI00369E1BCF